jgi:hypothetical protein
VAKLVGCEYRGTGQFNALHQTASGHGFESPRANEGPCSYIDDSLTKTPFESALFQWHSNEIESEERNQKCK